MQKQFAKILMEKIFEFGRAKTVLKFKKNTRPHLNLGAKELMSKQC